MGNRFKESQSDREAFWAWAANCSIPNGTIKSLEGYAALLLEQQKRTNLISNSDIQSFRMRHLAECLDEGFLEAVPEHGTLLDVGSGGGLPGIPLAIMRPQQEVILVEPRQKRAAFLDRCCLKLGLHNTRVEARTLQELLRSRPEIRVSGAVSRAIRWDGEMIDALRGAASPSCLIIRFGGPEPADGVGGTTLGVNPVRAAQIWPKPTWDLLASL